MARGARDKREERVLDAPPGFGRLFARAGTGALPLASRLPGLGASRSSELPQEALALENVRVDRERLARYSRVCGFDLRDRLPVTFPHILAFPLQLALMTDPGFPFPAIGLVHIENEITQRRPLGADEQLSLRVWAEDLRAHPRGRQFSLRTEVRVGDELVWEETSVNLRRGGGAANDTPGRSGGADRAATDDHPDESPELRETAVWRLRGDLGRRYGAVAGDLNPIHLHPLSARLFGFPRPIAHGMWTKARCLAALDASLPDALSVQVRFRRPIPLPGQVTFETGVAPDGATFFTVRATRGGSLHLQGSVSRVAG